jgi:hypothetical protein
VYLCHVIAEAYELGEVLFLAGLVWGCNGEEVQGLLLMGFLEQPFVRFLVELAEGRGHLVARVEEALHPESQLCFELLLHMRRRFHLVQFLVQPFQTLARLSLQHGSDFSQASTGVRRRGFVLEDGFQRRIHI